MLEKSKIHLVSFLRTNEPMRFLKAPSAKNWHTQKNCRLAIFKRN